MLPIIHPLVLFSEVFPPANTPPLCRHHFNLNPDDDDDDADEDGDDGDHDEDGEDDDKEGFAITEETVAACLFTLAVT